MKFVTKHLKSHERNRLKGKKQIGNRTVGKKSLSSKLDELKKMAIKKNNKKELEATLKRFDIIDNPVGNKVDTFMSGLVQEDEQEPENEKHRDLHGRNKHARKPWLKRNGA